MRRVYMLKLVGERFTGAPAENYTNAHMERGKTMEAEARAAYAFEYNVDPIPVGFIRNGNVGCSPDSLIGDDGMVEIKTKLPHLQLEALLSNKMPPEHRAQVQGQLWVAEREFNDFVSYWPRLPMIRVRVRRESSYIAMLKSEVERFNDDLDALTEEIMRHGATLAEGIEPPIKTATPRPLPKPPADPNTVKPGF